MMTTTPDEEDQEEKAAVIQAELDCIIDAITKAITESDYYIKLREEKLKNEDKVNMTISVEVNTLFKSASASVSGTISLKNKAFSDYEDPDQPNLF